MKIRTPALVLRTRPFKESDLIVELLGPGTGRLSAVARGGRKSSRRFGAALEIGTRLEVHVNLRRGRDLHGLEGCDRVRPVGAARTDLQRYAQLAYVLELARLTSREGAPDADAFALVVAYVDALDAAPASREALAVWELGLLAHLGYGLRLWPCVQTGLTPDAISLDAGGAVRGPAAGAADLSPVPPEALRALDALSRGEEAELNIAHEPAVRGAMERIWTAVTGYRLRSAEFLRTSLRSGAAEG